MDKIVPYLKAGAVGFITGICGAILGAIPIGLLHYFIAEGLVKIFGSYAATPGILLFTLGGFPLPFMAAIIVPICGSLFGIIGAIVGLMRHSRRVWLWGGISGFLFNFLVSFWAQ